MQPLIEQVQSSHEVAARCCRLCWLGRTRYEPVWQLQKRLLEERKLGRGQDVLLLTEHEPVYTLGRRGTSRNHLLESEAEIRRQGFDLFEVERGGDITFHGPGQLVGYPILDLRPFRPDVHYYLRQLEGVLIDTLADFGIEASAEPGMTGVWTPLGKIAALGVHIARWITMHGFALNVSTDLSNFRRIVPCGIAGRSVTSMSCLLGRPVTIQEARSRVQHHFLRRFHYEAFEGEHATAH